jgi:hypothetical protein
MKRWAFLFLSLSLAAPVVAQNQPTKNKKSAEEEKEWKNFKYYRARFDSDRQVNEDEKERAKKVREAQNLPIAKDGLPVVAPGENPVVANPTANPTENNGSATPVEPTISPEDLIAAEKRKQEEEARKAKIEADKARLLGDEKRDDKGQIIDEDDPTEVKVEEKKGFFKRVFGRKKKDAAESEE